MHEREPMGPDDYQLSPADVDEHVAHWLDHADGGAHNFDWVYHENFPVSKLRTLKNGTGPFDDSPDGWKSWLQRERSADAQDENDDGRWGSDFEFWWENGADRTPIVASQQPYGFGVEDGNHRTAVSHRLEMTHVPTFVGYRKVLGKAERKVREVASVALKLKDQLLVGERNDNGKITLPGGHLEVGETPRQAARRELREEAGLDLPESRFVPLGTGKVGGVLVHSFVAEWTKSDAKDGSTPSGEGDPDGEVSRWWWADDDAFKTDEDRAKLHSPRNVTLALIDWIPADGLDLERASLQKAGVVPFPFGDSGGQPLVERGLAGINAELEEHSCRRTFPANQTSQRLSKVVPPSTQPDGELPHLEANGRVEVGRQLEGGGAQDPAGVHAGQHRTPRADLSTVCCPWVAQNRHGEVGIHGGHFLHPHVDHNDVLTVTAYGAQHPHAIDGEATFVPQFHYVEDGDGFSTGERVIAAYKGWDVAVRPSARRGGLASAMYRHAQKVGGVPVVAGDFQTPDGIALLSSLGKSEVDPIHALVQHFGLTRDHREAGYVLPDGRMFDLSGKYEASGYQRSGDYNMPDPGAPDYLKGGRATDHRDLPEHPAFKGPDYSSGLIAVQNMGLLRHMPGIGFSMSRMPTDQQLTAVVAGHRRSYPSEPLSVDLDNEKGDTVAAHLFDRPTVGAVKAKLAAHFGALAKGENGDWRAEGYTIEVRKRRPDFLLLQARTASGEDAGLVGFYFHRHDKLIAGPDIGMDHQRKGLATAMYALAEKETGRKVVPDDIQSHGAKGLWGQPDRPFGKSEPDLGQARAFVVEKWRQRAAELGRPAPADLTGACKFASQFAAQVFGGTPRGNWHHQWVEHPTMGRIDLTNGDGVTGHDARCRAAGCRAKAIDRHDSSFWNSREHRDSMRSVQPRVESWVEEFKGATPLGKSEPDEVENLLAHPDAAERQMALKLGTVNRYHLGLALAHADPAVRRTALAHPGCGPDLTLAFLSSPGSQAEHVLALGRPDSGPAHLDAAWSSAERADAEVSAPRDRRGLHLALAEHPALDRDLWRKMWDSPAVTCKLSLLAHPSAAPDVLGQVPLAELSTPMGLQGTAMAAEALRHPCCPPQVLQAILRSSRADLRLSAAGNPDLPPELVTDLLAQARANPQSPDLGVAERVAALGGWNVTSANLDDALRDPNLAVRLAALRAPATAPRHLLRASVHEDPAVVAASETLGKAELLVKARGLFAQTAFRHKASGKVYPSGPIHDYSSAFDANDPDVELRQLATEGNNLDEYGFVKEPVVEAGFLGHDGTFYTRSEAAKAAYNGSRPYGGDSDALREDGHLGKVERHYTPEEQRLMGSNAGFPRAVLRRVPLNLITGEDPEPADWLDDDGKVRQFVAGTPVTKPIGLDASNTLHDGNHRLRQARLNGDLDIPALVEAPSRFRKNEGVQPPKHPALPTSPEGADLVDHAPHYAMHPPDVQHFADNYRAVLAGTQKTAEPDTDDMGGRSSKYVLDDVGGEPEGTRYLVKPYHDGDTDFGDLPIAGWAEMASQGIHHAAGIGHLHQSVHVADHAGEPRQVCRMLPGFRSVSRFMRMDDADRWHVPDATEQTRLGARKLAVMQFLSGNHDAHEGNVVMHPDGRVQAIDHGRAFQYGNPAESFGGYLTPVDYAKDSGWGGAVGLLDPQDVGAPEGRAALREAYRPVMAWWWGARHKVREEFGRHLPLIRDPHVRAERAQQFAARARWLDHMADGGLDELGDAWYEHPLDAVPVEKSLMKAQVPEGLISPEGEWIPLRGGAHSVELGHRSGFGATHNEPSNPAYEAGWISVGHAGGANAVFHSSLKPDHPAMAKLREIGRGWGRTVELETERAADFGEYDAGHFCRTGALRRARPMLKGGAGDFDQKWAPWLEHLRSGDPLRQDQAYAVLARNKAIVTTPAAETHGFTKGLGHDERCANPTCDGSCFSAWKWADGPIHATFERPVDLTHTLHPDLQAKGFEAHGWVHNGQNNGTWAPDTIDAPPVFWEGTKKLKFSNMLRTTVSRGGKLVASGVKEIDPDLSTGTHKVGRSYNFSIVGGLRKPIREMVIDGTSSSFKTLGDTLGVKWVGRRRPAPGEVRPADGGWPEDRPGPDGESRTSYELENRFKRPK